MTEAYTTQDLIDILAAERQACLRGERLNLTSARSTGHPVVDLFLQTDGLQKYTAYQGFKDAVHRYQREHCVSGIVWREIEVREERLRYPEVDAHLVALPEDMETLKNARESVLQFWSRATAGMDLYLSVERGKDHQSIEAEEIEAIAQRTEWATLLKWEKTDFLEMMLQLGWGPPEEASSWRNWPRSGSEYVHAVLPGRRPIG